MPVTSQDQLARLNALASGGSGALDAYDTAKQNAAGYKQSAIDSVMGANNVSNYGGEMTPQANQAVQSLIGQRTQGYQNDAASASNLAGAQVGYDQSALDAFMANNQAKLDEMRHESEQKNALDALQFQGQQTRLQRSIDRYNETAAQKAGNASAGFGNLSASDQNDIVTGAAREAQAQALSDLQSQIAEAQKNGDATKLKELMHKSVDIAKGISQTVNQIGANYGALPEAVRSGLNDEGIQQAVHFPELQMAGNAMERALFNPASGILPQYNAAEPGVSAAQEAYKRLMPEYGKTQLALPDYQQAIATQVYGMNPELAAGRYPNDEVAKAKIAQDLYNAQNTPDTIARKERQEAIGAYQQNRTLEEQAWEDQSGVPAKDVRAAAARAGLPADKALNTVDPSTWSGVDAIATDIQNNNDFSGAKEKTAAFQAAIAQPDYGYTAEQQRLLTAYYKKVFAGTNG